ncbi:MAG: DUF6796 family protein [Bacteroidota bacterium]
MQKQKTLFKIAGLLAIFGGVVCYVSDHFLRGGIAPGPAIDIVEFLPTVPFEPVLWGSILGYAALPLYLLGLWPLYRALEPAGRLLASVPVVLLGYTFTLFPGYHYSAVLYSLGLRTAAESSNGLLTEQLMQVHESALYVIMFPMATASIWIAILILSGKTLYARWMAFISPLLLPVVSPLIKKMIPSPWGAYVIPGSGTIVLILFIALAVWVSWPSPKRYIGGDPKVTIE